MYSKCPIISPLGLGTAPNLSKKERDRFSSKCDLMRYPLHFVVDTQHGEASGTLTRRIRLCDPLTNQVVNYILTT